MYYITSGNKCCSLKAVVCCLDDFVITTNWFSLDCRKTKLEVTTLANHNRGRQANEPIRTRKQQHVAGAKCAKHVRASHDWFLVLLLTGVESGGRFFSQSQSVAMQNQRNREITFDNQLKTALLYL